MLWHSTLTDHRFQPNHYSPTSKRMATSEVIWDSTPVPKNVSRWRKYHFERKLCQRCFTLLGFYLTPDMSEVGGFQLIKQGNLRVEIHFAVTIKVIMYAEFDNIIEIDWNRQVLMVLNSKQERLRLVEFKYQKDYDWLDSKFHCSYLESRGVPGKKPRKIQKTGNYLPFISGSGSRLPVMQLPVTSFTVTP